MNEHALAWERASEWSEAISRMLDRNLAVAANSLASPTSSDSARARRIVALLVETLGGYAYGMVAAQVARAVATWFGAEHAARVRGAARSTAPVPALAPPLASDAELARELACAPVELVEELTAALRIRFALLGERLGALVEHALHALPAGPGQAAALADQLRADLARDDRLALEITTGWHYASAVIEHRPIASIGSPRARELWRTWSRLAGHGEADPIPDQPGDYITRIG